MAANKAISRNASAAPKTISGCMATPHIRTTIITFRWMSRKCFAKPMKFAIVDTSLARRRYLRGNALASLHPRGHPRRRHRLDGDGRRAARIRWTGSRAIMSRLVLEIGEHDDGYVDAYYGPPAWRRAAHAAPRTLARLADRRRRR